MILTYSHSEDLVHIEDTIYWYQNMQKEVRAASPNRLPPCTMIMMIARRGTDVGIPNNSADSHAIGRPTFNKIRQETGWGRKCYV